MRRMTFVLPSLVFASIVAAQPGPRGVECLDTLVLNAEFVFVGRITEIHLDRSTPMGTNVVVEVREHLKGDVSEVTQAEISAPEATLRAWLEMKTPLLIVNGGVAKAVDLSSLPRLLTSKLRPLRDPEDALRVAREAIRRHPGVLRIATFSRRVGLDEVSRVPADADLERWSESTLADSHKPVWERGSAANALRFFPSETHIALLKRLLRDEGTVVRRRAVDNGGWQVDAYYVRENAYRTLREWGVKIDESVTEHRTLRPDPPKR